MSQLQHPWHPKVRRILRIGGPLILLLGLALMGIGLTSFFMAMGGNNPGSVLIPKGVVHGYRCISVDCGVVINCPDRLFMGQGKAEPIDEIRHEDDPENPFVKDERARRAHLQ